MVGANNNSPLMMIAPSFIILPIFQHAMLDQSGANSNSPLRIPSAHRMGELPFAPISCNFRIMRAHVHQDREKY